MTTRKPIVVITGQTQESPAGDLLLGAGLVKKSVSAGHVATVPAGYQYLVYRNMAVAGQVGALGQRVQSKHPIGRPARNRRVQHRDRFGV